MIKWKQISSLVLATGMVFSMTGCGGSNNGSTTTSTNEKATTQNATEEKADASTEGASSGDINYDATLDELTVGDYSDLTATVKFLTCRTDIVDTVYEDYKAQFKEIYPNITLEVEGVTDYEQDVLVRLTTPDWGTMCLIPNITKAEFPNYFVPLGDYDTLSENYLMLNDKTFDGQVYAIPCDANAQGIVYNKKVFEEAGITELPKTPDEFLDALQTIKDKTDAIPMYSNFSAGWTMGAWNAYLGGSATGDADFMNIKLPHMKDPFTKKDDMTGPYAVYYILYEATARGLIEDDPTTSDWEGSKGMMNRGEVATMVLGSWAVSQMQGAGENPDDVGYMPFPITQPDGKQYATAAPDYCYGVNINATDEEKLAAKLFIKWLTEESNYAYDQGCIPIVKGSQFPNTLVAFEGLDLVSDNPAKPGEETLMNDVNTESEIGLNMTNDPVCAILEAALTGSQTLDEIMAEWNAKWTAAQETCGAEILY